MDSEYLLFIESEDSVWIARGQLTQQQGWKDKESLLGNDSESDPLSKVHLQGTVL